MFFRTFAADMRKILFFMIAAIVVLASCNDYETYGDQKEKERNAINKFIADSSITVISEDVFTQNGCKTDLSRNEFVKLDKSGVYMQIVRQGCGTKMQNGETANLICRCRETIPELSRSWKQNAVLKLHLCSIMRHNCRSPRIRNSAGMRIKRQKSCKACMRKSS